MCSWRITERQHVLETVLAPDLKGAALPNGHDEGLTSLCLILLSFSDLRSLHLRKVVPQYPGFSHLGRFRKNLDISKFIVQWSENGGSKKDCDKDLLAWCLFHVMRAPNELHLFEHSKLFNFLDEKLSES